jgi:hypothetical protein
VPRAMPPWLMPLMAGIAQGHGMVLVTLPGPYMPGPKGKRGKRERGEGGGVEKGKGHHSFKAACP